MKHIIFRYSVVISTILLLWLFIAPDFLEARRGSFRGSRPTRQQTQKPKQQQTQQMQRTNPGTAGATSRQATTSFGGKRTTNAQAQQKYGTPRNTETVAGRNAQGIPQNYVVNSYGGYSSGLMRGYMMGSVTSTMMWMPWYGAFWYSRPYYAENEDGSVSVYPPTFDFSKIFLILIIAGVGVFIIRTIVRSRKQFKAQSRQSSFS